MTFSLNHCPSYKDDRPSKEREDYMFLKAQAAQ